MRNEFKSVKAFSKTWKKLNYVREGMRFLGYHLTKSAVLDMGVDLMAKTLKTRLEKMNKEQDGDKE